MNLIYQEIAEEHGITVEEVKRKMQAAIGYAYKKSNKTAGERAAQERISYHGETPTAEEVIAHIILIREIR